MAGRRSYLEYIYEYYTGKLISLGMLSDVHLLACIIADNSDVWAFMPCHFGHCRVCNFYRISTQRLVVFENVVLEMAVITSDLKSLNKNH